MSFRINSLEKWLIAGVLGLLAMVGFVALIFMLADAERSSEMKNGANKTRNDPKEVIIDQTLEEKKPEATPEATPEVRPSENDLKDRLSEKDFKPDKPAEDIIDKWERINGPMDGKPVEVKSLKELENKMKAMLEDTAIFTDIEDRLVKLVVKFDDSNCGRCNDRDRKLLLQMKMIDSIRNGDFDSAYKIMDKLDKYMDKDVVKPNQGM